MLDDNNNNYVLSFDNRCDILLCNFYLLVNIAQVFFPVRFKRAVTP